MTLDCDAIRGLVPHHGAMCLIDAVEFWDASSIVCTTSQHRSPGNPLALDGRLSVVHAIEFAAQAMAIHGAIGIAAGHAKPRMGLLLSVRDCRFHCDRLDRVAGDLHVKAHRLAGSAIMLMYRFTVSADGGGLAEGRATVLLRDPADEDAGA
jgi:predicted hotdog family 3-hydroxylacyl-ACP dehydratase